MSNVEKEYVERDSPVDSVMSSHNEFLKSGEYSSEDKTGYRYSDMALGSIYRYWHGELQNEYRSDRSKEVCNTIAERALFELAWRNGKIEQLEELYKEQEA